MISAVSTNSPYSTYGAYGASYANRARTQGADQAQSAQRSLVMTARKAPQPETPVQPVAPVRAVSSQEDPVQAGLQRYNADASEVAVRMRIQQPGDTAQQGNAAQAAGLRASVATGKVTINGHAIDNSSAEYPLLVYKDGSPLDLTQREYELVKTLASSRGQALSRESLMKQVWNFEGFVGDVRAVDVAIRRLREKIEDDPADPKFIITRRGLGYAFGI